MLYMNVKFTVGRSRAGHGRTRTTLGNYTDSRIHVGTKRVKSLLIIKRL